MSIYVWKLGEIALARVCKKVYAKVKIVKNSKGIFHDEKVLGITSNEDGSIDVTEELCYYVEISRRNEKLWLPYTSLHLAQRSRPFYGAGDKVSPPKSIALTPRKRKTLEDHTLPMEVKLPPKKQPCLNTTYDMRHMPLKQSRYENAFKEFVRRGKEMIFDEYYAVLEQDMTRKEDLDYLLNIDASTEDKFEVTIKNIATEKEIESYLHQCWRYNFVHKQKTEIENVEASVDSPESPTEKQSINVHITWCLVCGKRDKLRQCISCPCSYHIACRKEWLVTIIHRKNPPKKPPKQTTIVEKILSSTRTICSVRKEKENLDFCPSCMWGPRVGYDDVVWHKLGSCPWWPARVLPPGAAPSCLLSRTHRPQQWPLQYYGTLNYSWGDANRMCLFLPSHAATVDNSKDEMLQQAAMDACDDYISVYLT